MPKATTKPTRVKTQKVGDLPDESPAFEAEKKYVLYQKHIDKFTALASRVELTPAVCDECGLDIMDINEIDGRYDEQDAESRQKLKEAVDAHKKLVHTRDKLRVLDGSDVPNSWLGTRYKGRPGAKRRRR